MIMGVILSASSRRRSSLAALGGRRAVSWAAASSSSSSGASSGRRRSGARGQRDQAVGEPGVLREQRAVQVGAEHVQAAHALAAVGAVVAVPVQHPAERLGVGPEVGAPAVVLEAGQRPAAPPPRSTSIETLPISRGPARARSRGRRCPRPGMDARRRAGSCGRAADSRRRRRAARRRRRPPRRSRRACVAQHVLGDQHLVAVLAAADVDQVVRAGSKPSPGPAAA